MYNVVNKSAHIIILSTILAVGQISCTDSNRNQAAQLSARAETEIQSGNYEAALILLDTLDNHYAKQVEVRRSAMKFRAMAVEGVTLRRIAECDDSLAIIKARIDNSESKFQFVKNPGKNLGGNYIDKSIAKMSLDIMPRINDDGYFTLSVTTPGRTIGLKSIRFTAPGGDFQTDQLPSSRVVRVENSEMTVLQQEEIAPAIEWLQQHRDANAYQLIGSKSTIKGKMSTKLLQATIATYQYALDRQAYTQALIEREKLERKLQLARNQLANVIDR